MNHPFLKVPDPITKKDIAYLDDLDPEFKDRILNLTQLYYTPNVKNNDD